MALTELGIHPYRYHVSTEIIVAATFGVVGTIIALGTVVIGYLTLRRTEREKCDRSFGDFVQELPRYHARPEQTTLPKKTLEVGVIYTRTLEHRSSYSIKK
ncbi:hypothetical protein B0O99DRAFT_692020 [Bisporella sp. PMI_857]|nr:hypothetical protein B0O99DRAFT_692020 [Bisporella sp. PMI_857]